MKINQILALCGVASALCLGTASLFAQQDNGGGGGQGGQGGGGMRRRAGGGGPGGTFDPAQFQQMRMDRYREQLGFTNDTEWSAVQPLVQKVMDAQRDTFSGMGRGMFGRTRSGDQGGRGGDQGGPGGGRGGFGTPNPDADALQKAIDDNAPVSQIKDLLAKYKASQKAKRAKLEAAQADLKAVLAPGKQEAQAALLGLVN